MKALDHFIIQGLLKRLLSEKYVKSLFGDYVRSLLDCRRMDFSENSNRQLLSGLERHLKTHHQLSTAKALLTRSLAENDELYPHRETILEVAEWPDDHLQFLRDVFQDIRFAHN